MAEQDFQTSRADAPSASGTPVPTGPASSANLPKPDSTGESPAGERTRVRASPTRILLLLLGAIVVLGLGATAWVFEWHEQVATMFEPDLVPARGRVTYRGEPIPSGLLMTAPLDGQPIGPIGIIEADGTFKLLTQKDGRYYEGAYPGRYKVTVSYGHRAPMQFGFTPLVPEEYVDLRKTPLTMTIDSDPRKNDLTLVVTGELSEAAQKVLKEQAEQAEAPTPGDSPDGPRSEAERTP